MRVLNIPRGADTGGCGIRTKWAFDKHAPDWTYNLCGGTPKYMLYPVDRPRSEALDLWRKADVVHVRNDFSQQGALNAPNRPTVIHHHGTWFRTNHESLRTETRQRNAVAVTSTLDLWLIAPDELEWLPSPYDLDWLATFRRPINDGVLRIAHAPTDRKVKSTEQFLRAVDRLGKELPVEPILIENATWADTLRLKGTADIYFDQIILGYGNNSIEAWGMGIPVICGAQDPTLEEYERRFGSLPFFHADNATIYEALLALADPEERAVWAKRGNEHARAWHDERLVVEQLKGIYTHAYNQHA